jgi:hypothetical protein
MANATLVIKKLVQDSQEYGSDDEYMVSRVFFDLVIDSQVYQELTADIKQMVGSSFEDDPCEISLPSGYDGPINYQAYRDIIENYFRKLVGEKGSAINISGGTNIRMQDNTFIFPMSFTFSVD